MIKTLAQVRRTLGAAPLHVYRVIKTGKLSSFSIFFYELIRNPKSVGALCPSSPRLARHMAAKIPLTDDGIVIELGGGTGVITKAILNRGIPPERLYVVEKSRKLCKLLRKRFKGVNIIEDDASYLSNWIDTDTRVDAVVSGLPLKSLPKSVVNSISLELDKLLPSGCTLIQFTYDLRRKQILKIPSKRTDSKVIWNNFPPARIDVSEYL